ncbi:hypothetical protein, partial [uncultured Ruthenibacterium sp.]|uniref:hypothetical protein n=1 Tax=uncultured Ruthenibacterium sp. TaxID=1905347 RepID=UPI00259579B4
YYTAETALFLDITWPFFVQWTLFNISPMFIPPFSGEMTAKIKKLHSKNEMQLFWWERMDSNHRSEDATDLQCLREKSI